MKEPTAGVETGEVGEGEEAGAEEGKAELAEAARFK